MSRLTKRTAEGYAYLANVKEDEQEVDSPYRNTLQCILDSFEKLAKYEDLGEPEELQRKSEWISVEEQLPPYGELVLVYIPTYEKTDDIHKAAFDFVWYMPDSKVFYDRETNYHYQLEHVSHWQRLQKPSKE